MQRKLSFGGIFLLFLLFFTILSCIHPGTTSTGVTISTEDTFPYTENIISSTEDITPPE
ncbi:MAG: hypothetical protein HXS54_18800, partial [Theionarchaea archaeon]|nr:hypothetical protein [Theionarchaea archaeon]